MMLRQQISNACVVLLSWHWPLHDGCVWVFALQALTALPVDSIATSISKSFTCLAMSMRFAF